jgi:hypothetical protein
MDCTSAPALSKDVLVLQPGATQDVRFKAGEPGTYYYWASTTDSPVAARMPIESQLAGAFIVDPPDPYAMTKMQSVGTWTCHPKRLRPKRPICGSQSEKPTMSNI